MIKANIPLIAIVGPTASGKSALAVHLAKHFNGQVISADSRQVYRGLNLGTGKITRREMQGVPHHLLDIASPKHRLTVVDFQRRAEQAIGTIRARGRIPILVGGTGFWIDAVILGRIFPPVPPQPRLRRQLERKSPAELLAILKKLDPARAKTVEPKNPRRLIRAIEIAKGIGRVPDGIKNQTPYRTLWIGIRPPAQTLRRRIRKRLAQRLRAGMVAEARGLRARGLPWRRFYELGLEYRFLAEYLQGEITKPEMTEGLERAIRRYAKRQLGWFKRNRRIRWVENGRAAERRVKTFLSRR